MTLNSRGSKLDADWGSIFGAVYIRIYPLLMRQALLRSKLCRFGDETQLTGFADGV